MSHVYPNHYPQSQPEPLPPAPPDWFQRNWKWALPVGCGFLLLASVGSLVALFAFVFGMMKNSGAYTEALDRARAHPEAVEALGLPIEPGFFVTGDVHFSGTTGRADLAIPVSGPNGSGTLYVAATKQAGIWTYQRLVLELEGGRRIDLLSVAPAGVEV